MRDSTLLRPHSEWHEDFHSVLWWLMPIVEPPLVGSPLDDDWPYEPEDEPRLFFSLLPSVWDDPRNAEHLTNKNGA